MVATFERLGSNAAMRRAAKHAWRGTGKEWGEVADTLWPAARRALAAGALVGRPAGPLARDAAPALGAVARGARPQRPPRSRRSPAGDARCRCASTPGACEAAPRGNGRGRQRRRGPESVEGEGDVPWPAAAAPLRHQPRQHRHGAGRAQGRVARGVAREAGNGKRGQGVPGPSQHADLRFEAGHGWTSGGHGRGGEGPL
jgi:hypothetical protein